jgi:long-subunit acyl-CoA synthetase (AMP-forming)
VNTLREVEPTSHMGVPRVWEKIMERIQEVAAQSGFIRRKVLLWAMSVTLEQNLSCPSRYRRQGVGSLQRQQGWSWISLSLSLVFFFFGGPWA